MVVSIPKRKGPVTSADKFLELQLLILNSGGFGSHRCPCRRCHQRAAPWNTLPKALADATFLLKLLTPAVISLGPFHFKAISDKMQWQQITGKYTSYGKTDTSPTQCIPTHPFPKQFSLTLLANSCCLEMAVGVTSFAFMVSKCHRLLVDERLHISSVTYGYVLSCSESYWDKSCSSSTVGRWRLSRDDRIIRNVTRQEKSSMAMQDALSLDNQPPLPARHRDK